MKMFNTDEIYICVMMTSSQRIDLFSFEVTREMLQFKNNKEFRQARCHLITYVMEKHIAVNYPKNTMKASAVNRLIVRINKVALEDF